MSNRLSLLTDLLVLFIGLLCMGAMKKATVDKGHDVIIQKWYGEPRPKPVRDLWC